MSLSKTHQRVQSREKAAEWESLLTSHKPACVLSLLRADQMLPLLGTETPRGVVAPGLSCQPWRGR